MGVSHGEKGLGLGGPSDETRINLKDNWPGRKTPYCFRAVILLLSAHHLSVPLLSSFLLLKSPGSQESGALALCLLVLFFTHVSIQTVLILDP